jgi:tRNA(adenine34) deaminase
VSRLVYATLEPKSGAVESAFSVLGSAALNHEVRVSGGVLAESSADLLRNFFAKRRQSECSAQGRRFPR